jgi:predicted Fe-Mo cluster-binding NifX family protein
MKYAVPLDNRDGWDSYVGQHFGKVPYYAIWNEEDDSLDIIHNGSNHRGGVGMPMEFLADKCSGVLCKGVGARAVALGNQLNLEVYMGAVDTLKDTISLFKEGKLRKATADDGCRH